MPQLAVADFMTETIQAEVVDPSTGHPMWTEEHVYEPEAARKRVVYTGPDGRNLGEKRVVFRDTPTLPSVRWDSPLDGSSTELRIARGRATVVRRSTADPRDRQLMPVPARGVADSGLEVLVRKAWKTLIYGKTVQLELWRAETARFFPYCLERTGFCRWKGRPAVRFRLAPERGDGTTQPSSTRFTIDAYTRSLVQFEGPLSLPGSSLEVRMARLEVDLPLPGPLSRPDVADDDE